MYEFYEKIRLHATGRIVPEDAARQDRTAREILRRLVDRPGLILADEVGMGKTFVALAVAVSTALANRGRRPVVVMTPPALKEKWEADFKLFREKCIDAEAGAKITCGTAQRAEEFLKLLDDPPARRKSVIIVTHGAMSRGLQDPWVKLAFVRRALHHLRGVDKKRNDLLRNGLLRGLIYNSSFNRVGDDALADLLVAPASAWLEVQRKHGIDPEGDDDPTTDDDPVPQAIVEVLDEIDVQGLREALDEAPTRYSSQWNERITRARRKLNDALRTAWHESMRRINLQLPLLILDEAHHLKNADTQLAGLFRSHDSESDAEQLSRKGALHGAFERMLFLTATPFQLGHSELCSVLERFDGIRWDVKSAPQQGRNHYHTQLTEVRSALDQAQETAVSLDQVWGRLRASDLTIGDEAFTSIDLWWPRATALAPEDADNLLTSNAACVVAAFHRCRSKLELAEQKIQPWVIRHLKPRRLPQPFDAPRRKRLTGSSIIDDQAATEESGLTVAGEALLPFLLAARATASAPESRPVFAEGLASSYEAFLETRLANIRAAVAISVRSANEAAATESDVLPPTDGDHDSATDISNTVTASSTGEWYLDRLEAALRSVNGERPPHPKVDATVRRAVAAWRHGEKVLVFCHYVRTGQILRRRISEAIHEEILKSAAEQLQCTLEEAEKALERIGDRFFDGDSPARQRCEELTDEILANFSNLAEQREQWVGIVRRNLRTPSFLARFFPLGADSIGSEEVTAAFEKVDHSGLTLRSVLTHFFAFLSERCGAQDRDDYLRALEKVQTGSHAESALSDAFDSEERDGHDTMQRLLPNVRLANGRTRAETRRRLMLTFNTPFYPEVLIASSVMAEGVDLHRNCRYVIHHDLCWNPSMLEQRTGRVDRIGAKTELCGRPIHVYLPYVAATQDEKMYRVVMDRERWFGVVMGENYQVDARTTEKLAERLPLPEAAAAALAFRLEAH